MYWMDLASRLGFESSVYQPQEIPSLETLGKYFDSTPPGLQRVVQEIDRDNDETISIPEIASGLQQRGIYTHHGLPIADAAFQELINMISTSNSGASDSSSSARHAHITEFLSVLRNLRLGPMFHVRQDFRMHLHEYSKKLLNSECPVKEPIAFLFKPASECFFNYPIHARLSRRMDLEAGANVYSRWLHVYEASTIVVLGLAVKYELEPQYVEYLFTLWSANAKVEVDTNYGTHDAVRENAAAAAPSLSIGRFSSASSLSGLAPRFFNLTGAPSIDRYKQIFIVLPILRLSDHSRDTLRKYQAWRRGVPVDLNSRVDETLKATPCVEIIVEYCTLAVFVLGGSTTISFGSKREQLVNLNTGRMIAESRNAKISWLCNKRTNNTLVDLSSGVCPINQTVIGSKHSGTRSTLSDRVSKAPQLAMPDKVLAELTTSYTRLRCGDAHTFSRIVLREITEDYLLIAVAFKAFLEIMLEKTFKEKEDLKAEEVARFDNCIFQLSKLRSIVKHVAITVDKLSSSQQWSDDSKLCMDQIKSNVSLFLEELSASEKDAAVRV